MPPSTSDSQFGTASHGDNDGESNYEGGLWVRSEDTGDFNLAITEGWIDWTTSGEASGGMRVDAGYFSQYDQRAVGHC